MLNAIEHLAKRSRVTARGCWVTEGGHRQGYSQVSVKGRSQLAHLVAYTALRAQVPEGLELDHVDCESTACWNPWHVEPVTHAENMARHREKKYGARKLGPIWERQPGYSTERVREWRARDPERVREYERAYRERNREKTNARIREWKRKNRQRQKEGTV